MPPTIAPPRPQLGARAGRGNTLEPWTRAGLTVLVLSLAAGSALRLYDLSGPSFAEDELYKVRAVQSYQRGQWTLTGDDEHPLTMKLLIYASYAVTAAWNEVFAEEGSPLEVSLESATRAPNALVGAFTGLFLALLARRLFSRRAGLIAAALWALEPSLIGYGRIAKEDTLLAFFLVLALYWVVRAKAEAEAGEPRARRSEVYAALSIGALLASKYFLHLTFIAPVFYALTRFGTATTWRISWRRWAALVGIAAGTFLVMNPTLLSPENLRYIFGYIGRSTVYHHGIPFLGELYDNQFTEGLSGTPWHYWLVFLGVKLSVPLLAAVALGLALALRRRREDGPRLVLVWLAIWLPLHSLIGVKFARWLPHLMPAVLLLAAFALDEAARFLAARIERRTRAWPSALITAALSCLVVAPLADASVRSAPHYRLWLNAFGGASANLRHFFPHCDFYDVGLREAVQYVCANAPAGARLGVESPFVARHYLQRCGRSDVDVFVLSKPSERCAPGDACFYVLQESQRHFETQALFDRLHAARAPDATIRVRGLNVAEIYAPAATPTGPGERAPYLQAVARAFGNASSRPPLRIESRDPPRMPGPPVSSLVLVSRFEFAADIAVEEPTTLRLRRPDVARETP